MATGSGSSSGPKGKAGTTRASGGGRKTSKPVIIDVEAEKASVAKEAKADASPAEANADAPGAKAPEAEAPEAQADAKADSKAADKPETVKPAEKAEASKQGDVKADAAKAGATKPAATAKSAAKQSANAPKADAPKPSSTSPSTSSVKAPDTVVPAAAAASAQSDQTGAQGGPSPFYLFAAGLIGALLAMVLMFLASVVGLFSVADGRVDEQAAALSVLETRVSAIEAQPVAEPFDAALLAPLETDIAALRADFEAANLGVSDALPSGDDALAADLIAPLEGRLAAVEESLSAALAGIADAQAAAGDGGEAAATLVPVTDPALAADVEALRSGLSSLQGEVESVAQAVAGLGDAEATLPPETAARLDALDGLLADAGTQITALGDELAAVRQQLETNEMRLSTMDEGLNALAEAPVAQAPDRLARLGVALDGLVAARDAGDDVAVALDVARAAAQFDGELADAFAPLSSAEISGPLDDASLLGAFDAVFEPMRAAGSVAEEGSGLLGALEERARQMVTIRAPADDGAAATAEPLDQLNALGANIADGRFSEALALAGDLPAAMQQASGPLLDVLHARVTLDDAIARARSVLLAQLGAPAETGEAVGQ